MWGSLQSSILMVSEIAWVGYITMLIAYVKFYPGHTSGIIALSVWCMTDLISNAGSPALYFAVAEGKVDYSLWFISFVILNTLGIVAISMLHRSYNIMYSQEAVTLMGLLLAMSVLHMIRLFDRMLLDLFPALYRYGLMSLKFLAFYLVFRAVRNTQRSVV